MKSATMLLIILAVGLVVTGCSKTSPTQTIPTSTQITADSSASADAIVVDDNLTNPDIGTLDDIAVSEEVPQ